MIARPSRLTAGAASIISRRGPVQLIVGNWKMNGTLATARELARGVARAKPLEGVQLAVAPSFPFIEPVRKELEGSEVALAAQNCAIEKEGAFTGEVSAEMLSSVGCAWVIVGHSERRALFGETDEVVAKKLTAG